MREIAINTKTYKLYIIEHEDSGEAAAREITAEDIAKLSKIEQALVRSLQQQAEIMRKLAEVQAQAALEIKKIECYCDFDRELLLEIKEEIKQGWGYKPKLNTAASKPHRAKTHWHRTRSFCVRKGYH